MTGQHSDAPCGPVTIRVAQLSRRTGLRARPARRIDLPVDTQPVDHDELRCLIAQYLELPASDIEITTRRRRRHLTIRIHR